LYFLFIQMLQFSGVTGGGQWQSLTWSKMAVFLDFMSKGFGALCSIPPPTAAQTLI
jgi:hypothetical protein